MNGVVHGSLDLPRGVVGYSDADGGQTAHHMLRWIGTTGEKGPWSETASATIGA
ncbi:MAG: hypothetical protein KAV82_07300 [Phycisphaerae bacterium]|nr:hypothetical protein [Phycisphaerae bacterium]